MPMNNYEFYTLIVIFVILFVCAFCASQIKYYRCNVISNDISEDFYPNYDCATHKGSKCNCTEKNGLNRDCLLTPNNEKLFAESCARELAHDTWLNVIRPCVNMRNWKNIIDCISSYNDGDYYPLIKTSIFKLFDDLEILESGPMDDYNYEYS